MKVVEVRCVRATATSERRAGEGAVSAAGPPGPRHLDVVLDGLARNAPELGREDGQNEV